MGLSSSVDNSLVLVTVSRGDDVSGEGDLMHFTFLCILLGTARVLCNIHTYIVLKNKFEWKCLIFTKNKLGCSWHVRYGEVILQPRECRIEKEIRSHPSYFCGVLEEKGRCCGSKVTTRNGLWSRIWTGKRACRYMGEERTLPALGRQNQSVYGLKILALWELRIQAFLSVISTILHLPQHQHRLDILLLVLKCLQVNFINKIFFFECLI